MRHRLVGSLALLLAGAVAAQAAPTIAEREARLVTTAVQSLSSFARVAESSKMFGHAKIAYEMLLASYDPEHKPSKAALAVTTHPWTDQGNQAQERSVTQAWAATRRKLATMHRELGQALLAGDDLVRGARHMERVLAFDPSDAVAHEALGHESHGGFHGTAEQIAFCKRLEAIDARAKELTTTGFEPKPLTRDEMPAELANSRLAVVGARTRGFKIWTTSKAQAVADDVANWAERGTELLEFLAPSGLRRAVRIDAQAPSWILIVRSDAEWNAFFAANPDVLAKAKLAGPPAAGYFRCDTSRGRAEIFHHPESLDADSIIAHVAMWGFASGHNEGLGQGLVHTLTSLLVGTTLTWFGEEPKTSASKAAPVPRDTKAWAQRLREELRAGKDVPLVQVPREKLTNFREAVRVKSCSFVTWLVARFPATWPRVFQAIETDKNPTPERIGECFAEELGLPLLQLEAEWREWARGDTPIAKASGRSG